VNRGRLAGVIAKHAEHAQPHASGSADWRAHVERVERTQLIEIPLDEICELEENLLPLVGLEFAPRAFERLAGGRDGAVDIFGVAVRNRGQQLASRRIAACEMLAGDGVVIVTVLMVFLAGMTLGGMLAGSASEPTRVAMNDTVPVAPDGPPPTVRQ